MIFNTEDCHLKMIQNFHWHKKRRFRIFLNLLFYMILNQFFMWNMYNKAFVYNGVFVGVPAFLG